MSENPTILVVDDTPENIFILNETLKDDYRVKVANNGAKALNIVSKTPPDIILLDIMMPEMDGYEVCRRLKVDDSTKDIPVIFLTALSDDNNEAQGLDLGAVDYITKPFAPRLVKARIRNQIELKRHRDHLEDLVRERTRELVLMQDVTIESMGTLAECRDPETGGHIKRTQKYLDVITKRLAKNERYSNYLSGNIIELLYKSAPLHDIGKVGIPDNILLKQGKLTDEEFGIMKTHTTLGRDMIISAENRLGRDSFLSYAREIAYTHHEKYDGTGYPQGLKGDEIPLSGRMMAIADVYDALISKRVYKPPFSHKKACQIIIEGSGKQFDPDIVDVFVDRQHLFREIALEFADFDEERDSLKRDE